jgi:hypothetical protein
MDVALLGLRSVERNCSQPPNVHSDVGTVRRSSAPYGALGWSEVVDALGENLANGRYRWRRREARSGGEA